MLNLSQPFNLGRRGDAAPSLVLVIVCSAVVMASLDLFIVNVALPNIARDFGTRRLGDLSWVLNGYAIVYAALLVLFGRLSESRRRDHGFLLGLVVFTVASAACGLANGLPMLVAFRILQAAGAALLTPTSLSLVLATSPPERRQAAVRAWTAVGGAAAALGPVVGGLLVAASWRWVFFVNVPIGALALIIAWRRLPHVPGHPVPRPDALGALLVTGGVAALSFGLVKGNEWGWGSARTVVALAASLIALGGFVVHTAQARNPLVDRELFRVRPFTGASLVAILFSTAFGGMLLSIVLWDQDVWGWSALQTGLAVAPGPLMVPLFAFGVAGRLIERYGPGRVIAIGSTAFAVGFIWWALAIGTKPAYASEMLGGMLLTGIGVGLTLPTFMATAAGSLPPHSFATGSAVVNMLRQVGLAIGVAVVVAVLGTPRGAAQSLAAFQHVWVAIAAIALVAAIAAGVLLGAPTLAASSELAEA